MRFSFVLPILHRFMNNAACQNQDNSCTVQLGATKNAVSKESKNFYKNALLIY